MDRQKEREGQREKDIKIQRGRETGGQRDRDIVSQRYKETARHVGKKDSKQLLFIFLVVGEEPKGHGFDFESYQKEQ